MLARVRDEGPMTATELGGAKKTADWWGWSDIKASAEFLIATGELICTRRVGWRRVYDLPERVLPAEPCGPSISTTTRAGVSSFDSRRARSVWPRWPTSPTTTG